MTAKVLKFKTAYGDRKKPGFETTGNPLPLQRVLICRADNVGVVDFNTVVNGL